MSTEPNYSSIGDISDMPPPEAPTVVEKAPRDIGRLYDAGEILDELTKLWKNPPATTSTGLVQLDALLSGGVRAGDMLALVGTAKAGKSAFFGQVLYSLAKNGALGIYASVEMPRVEVMARWIVREAFLHDYQSKKKGADSSWALSFGDVLYGRASRGEDRKGNRIADDITRENLQAKLLNGREAVRKNGKRLFVHHLKPGSSCLDLRALVVQARAKAEHTGPVVLLVDPIQRLWADESGQCKGTVLDRLNADETQRIGMVAQQLKELVDDPDLKLAVLFTSDTTKGAASKGGADSSTDMRGSYMLNHVATVIMSIKIADNTPDGIDGIDGIMHDDPRSKQLDARVALVEVSGNRRGPAKPMAFTYVPGAMTFAEKPYLDLDDMGSVTHAPPAPTSPTGRVKKGK